VKGQKLVRIKLEGNGKEEKKFTPGKIYDDNYRIVPITNSCNQYQSWRAGVGDCFFLSFLLLNYFEKLSLHKAACN